MRNDEVLSRAGFLSIVKDAQCPLYFPFLTEHVVVLRTGLLKHLSKYINTIFRAPEPIPAPSPPVAGPSGSNFDGEAEGNPEIDPSRSPAGSPMETDEPEGSPKGGPRASGELEREPDRGVEGEAGAVGVLEENVEVKGEPMEIGEPVGGTEGPIEGGPGGKVKGKPKGESEGEPMETGEAEGEVEGDPKAGPAGGLEGEPMEIEEDGGEGRLRQGSAEPLESKGREASAPAASPPAVPRVQAPDTPQMAVLRAKWENLRSRVEALRPVERFRIQAISYRKQAPLPACLIMQLPV